MNAIEFWIMFYWWKYWINNVSCPQFFFKAWFFFLDFSGRCFAVNARPGTFFLHRCLLKKHYNLRRPPWGGQRKLLTVWERTVTRERPVDQCGQLGTAPPGPCRMGYRPRPFSHPRRAGWEKVQVLLSSVFHQGIINKQRVSEANLI